MAVTRASSTQESPSTPVHGGRDDGDHSGSVAGRGIIAGLAGATAIALFFLVVDGTQGQLFRTPAFLARALLGSDQVTAGFGPVLLYTLVHYGVFVLLGLAMSWMLTHVEVGSPLLLGTVLGFLLFDLIFYGSVAATGVDVVAALGWPVVLVGNLLGGVSLVGVLHVTGATRRATWWAGLSENQVVREGIVSGVLGGLAVAAWFLIIDVIKGHPPLFTPGALGSSLFLGAGGLADVHVNALTVGGYTVVHFATFIVAGLLAAAIVTAADETPPLALGAMLFFAAFEAFFMGLIAMVAQFLLGAMSWWSILAGNVLAALVMGSYLWRHHPRLRAALRENPMD